MSKILIPWKHCAFDSSEFGTESSTFFHGVNIEKSEIDFQIEEMPLLDILSKRFKGFLLDLFEVGSDWNIATHLVEPFVIRDKVPGDIDLLILNPDTPDYSMAIEAKIFKKKQSNFRNNFVSNIQRIREGLDQAEGLRKLGFSSVYFMAIIISNTSILEEDNLVSRTVDESNWGKIRAEFLRLRRGRKIGLAALEVCQNTAKPFVESGSISGFVYYSYKINQDISITNKIKHLR